MYYIVLQRLICKWYGFEGERDFNSMQVRCVVFYTEFIIYYLFNSKKFALTILPFKNYILLIFIKLMYLLIKS